MTRKENSRSVQCLTEVTVWASGRAGLAFSGAAVVAAAALSPEDLVVEIGPGFGALTFGLAEAAGHVVAVELDSGIARAFREEYGEPEGITLVEADILHFDLGEAARERGAEGITVAGICCTANEVLMRHGIAVAGNFLQQELAIITGAVEVMVVDVQCCMPSLPEVAGAYHTEIVSTSKIARTVGATHQTFDENDALGSAKSLIRRAIDNYRNRDRERMAIPDHRKPLVGGFSVEAIKHMLAMAEAKHLLERLGRTTEDLHPSPLFDRLTGDEWRALHLLHAAHHLRFLIPAGS